jgi:hypothetical protein
VVVVVALVDGVTPLALSVELVPLAGPPMAPLPVVVDPGVAVPAVPLLVAGVPELLLEVDVSLLGAGAAVLGAGVVVLGAGVVVLDELEDDVVGVGASSRLVQAPSETAATSASAAHDVRDAFIRKLLKLFESTKGSRVSALSAL